MPADWQERMVEMIRGAEDLSPAWFTGGPVLSPLEQISVYRRQWNLRIYDAIIEEIPGLHRLLGDDADEVIRAYMLDCPPSSWTLNRIADRLPEWLEGRGAPTVQREMVSLDLAVQAGFDAACGTTIQPEELASMPPLRLQPHVTLLRFTHNVHWIRSRGTRDQEVPEIEAGDYPVVVFRRGIKMRHWEMSLGAWGILAGIDSGLGVEGAIEQAFDSGWLDPENLAANIQQWFVDYAERNLLEVVQP
jgi:hypothetical protein